MSIPAGSSYFAQVIMVGLGGFIGASARFMAGGLVQRYFAAGAFPLGTSVVNIVGCLLIGFLAGLGDGPQMLGPGQRRFLIVGVLGGFTTFSAFAFETLTLAQSGDLTRAFANVGLQVIVGLAAAWAGYYVAQYV
jgi:CrcB protein